MSILTTVGISFFTAWITMRLALHRFYREKWWDKRATAYLELIDVLYDFKTDYETIADNEHTKTNPLGDNGVANEEPLSKKVEAELWKRLSLTQKKLEKIKGLGPLIFTEDALIKISKFLEKDREVSLLAMNEALDNHDAYNEISNSADVLYKEFKNIALLELNVKPRYEDLCKKTILFLREQHECIRQYFRNRKK